MVNDVLKVKINFVYHDTVLRSRPAAFTALPGESHFIGFSNSSRFAPRLALGASLIEQQKYSISSAFIQYTALIFD